MTKMDERDDFDLQKISREAGEKVEKECIQKVLLETGWNRRKAARSLHVNYETLLLKVKKYRLNPICPVVMSKFRGTHAILYGRKEIWANHIGPDLLLRMFP